MNISLFSKTPTVMVLDNRGLTVRDITYHRHPDTPKVTNERITRAFSTMPAASLPAAPTRACIKHSGQTSAA